MENIFFVKPLGHGRSFRDRLDALAFVHSINVEEQNQASMVEEQQNQESMVDCMADGIQSLLTSLLAAAGHSESSLASEALDRTKISACSSHQMTFDEDNRVRQSPLLYAKNLNSGGGLLSILSAIFESTLIEMSDDADWLVKNTDRSMQADIVKALMQADIVKFLEDILSTVQTREQQEQLSRFVAALEISSAFPQEMLTGAKEKLKTILKQAGDKTEMTECDQVASWRGFVRVVESAFGPEHHCLPWARALKRFASLPSSSHLSSLERPPSTKWFMHCQVSRRASQSDDDVLGKKTHNLLCIRNFPKKWKMENEFQNFPSFSVVLSDSKQVVRLFSGTPPGIVVSLTDMFF